MKTRKFAFRISEHDYNLLKSKAEKAKITMTDFIIRSVTEKEIMIIDSLKPYLSQLKGIGRNLNQLTVLANMNKIQTVDLEETKQNLGSLYEGLSELTEENRNGNG